MVRREGHTREFFMREETTVANRTPGQVFHERRRLLGAVGLAGLGLFAGTVLDDAVLDDAAPKARGTTTKRDGPNSRSARPPTMSTS